METKLAAMRHLVYDAAYKMDLGQAADKTLTFVNEEVFSKSKTAKTGDIVMAVTSENVSYEL